MLRDTLQDIHWWIQDLHEWIIKKIVGTKPLVANVKIVGTQCDITATRGIYMLKCWIDCPTHLINKNNRR